MNLSIFNFKKFFRERMVWMSLFLLVFILIFHTLAPKTDEKRVIENNSFWKRKTFDKHKYQMVIGGDSRVYRGVSPQAMSKVFPELTITNFGYGSAGFDKIMLHEITKRIDFNASQKMVVLGITPLTLTRVGMLNYHLNYELKTKREELLELLYFKGVFQYFAPISLEQMEKKFKGKEFHTTFHQDYTPTGWVATFEDNPSPISALKSYSSVFINNKVTTENLQLVLNQVKKWNNEGVQVFGYRPPTTPKMVSLEDSLSGYNEPQVKEQFILAGGHWLEFNIEDYESYDGSHLQKESAIKFSVDLAQKIKYIVAD